MSPFPFHVLVHKSQILVNCNAKYVLTFDHILSRLICFIVSYGMVNHFLSVFLAGCFAVVLQIPCVKTEVDVGY
jgi:hypothetical protein